jgi:hypothetical protein
MTEDRLNIMQNRQQRPLERLGTRYDGLFACDLRIHGTFFHADLLRQLID